MQQQPNAFGAPAQPTPQPNAFGDLRATIRLLLIAHYSYSALTTLTHRALTHRALTHRALTHCALTVLAILTVLSLTVLTILTVLSLCSLCSQSAHCAWSALTGLSVCFHHNHCSVSLLCLVFPWAARAKTTSDPLLT